ncbi:MAG: hypothetical protein HKN76_04650 [Saprospiraceae bacterium]|nr:hypothetical protein [Saprospiraceae bacterium]
MSKFKVFLGITCIALFMLPVLHGQKLATLTMHSGSFARINSTVCADIEGLLIGLESHDLILKEVRQGQSVEIKSQLSAGESTRICWIAEGKTDPNEQRIFELWKAEKQSDRKSVAVSDDGKTAKIQIGDKDALSYQYAKAPVPAGVSEVYSRGGFIHPLWSPSGEVLTRIQPPDHYHHYGIWNPWTHTEYAGREVDFWNLAKEQGRVDVATSPIKTGGAVFGTIKALHHHTVLPDSFREEEKTVLNEILTIKVWNASTQQKYWIVDVISELSCASDKPLTLKEYRYQGFGYRGKAAWNDENVTLLTSEGFNKENGNATRAKWCDVRGPATDGSAGILFMTSPSNFNFPELLRIWPTGSNKGVENVFVNFNPTQDRDWVLNPGHTYVLKYRLLVYDGEMKKTDADIYWNDFAHPAKISVTPENTLVGKRILVFTKNGEGYVHDNIASSVKAIKKLGEENGFAVDATDSAAVFTSNKLMEYDAIVFSNTNNKTFDNEGQKIAFQEYIRSGKGFVGIHVASGSERNWPWYWKLVGGKFVRHPKFQQFEIEVIDHDHPSTYFLPDVWIREDECYFINKLNPANHVLLAARLPSIIDEKKKDYPGDTFGDLVPLAWCHKFDGGRQWYTALGHKIEHYEDPTFMRHILGGIQWVTMNE